MDPVGLIVGGGGTLLVGLGTLAFTARSTRATVKKAESDITSNVVEMIAKLNGELRQEIADLKSRLAAMEQNRDALLNRIAAMDRQIVELTAQNGELSDRVKALTSERDSLRAQVSDLTNEIHRLESRLQSPKE